MPEKSPHRAPREITRFKMMIGFLVGTQEVHVTPSSTSFPAAVQRDKIDLGNDREKRE